MNKKLDEYGKSDKLTEDYVLFESGAEYTLKRLKEILIQTIKICGITQATVMPKL